MRHKFILILAIVLLLQPMNVRAAQTELRDEIVSETAVLIDGSTGQVLFDKDMHKVMYPASITKIMTALLALENGRMYDEITMTDEAVFSITSGSTHIALNPGEVIALDHALHALAIESANDAANGIAELIGGTLEEFAEMMTQRAIDVGALSTSFVNAHGLSDENHYTTAYDMARIMMECIKLPRFREVFARAYYEIPPTNMQSETRYLHNKNQLVAGENKYDGIIASKSGWTTPSRHTLVTAAERDGVTLIAVVMNSELPADKYDDTRKLLDYGFGEFSPVTFSAEELSVEKYDVGGENVSLAARGDFTALLHNSLTKADVNYKYIAARDESATSGYSARAVFSIKPERRGIMPLNLGELQVSAYPTSIKQAIAAVDETDAAKESAPAEQPQFQHNVKLLLTISTIAAAAITIVVMSVALYIRKRRRIAEAHNMRINRTTLRR